MFGQMIQQLQNADTFSLTGRIENIVGMAIKIGKTYYEPEGRNVERDGR